MALGFVLYKRQRSSPSRAEVEEVKAMRRFKIIGFLFSCFLLTSLATNADACRCFITMEGAHPCQLYRQAAAVFVGQVSEIGPMTPVSSSQPNIYTTRDVVVRFTVEEGFRGVEGQTVTIYLTGTTCDFTLLRGERYFVYATRGAETQKLHVVQCSGTKLFNEAAHDLAYARGVARGEKGPDIFGTVLREVRTGVTEYRTNIGMPGIKVILESEGHRVEVFTDAEGRFEVTGLPPGRYKSRAEIPDNLRVTYHTEGTLEVGEGRCSGVAFVVTALGSINGKLVDAEGKPASDVTIHLVPVNASNQALVSNETYETSTEQDGRYRFDWLAAGRYLVVVNPQGQPASYASPYRRTYYPDVADSSQATVIVVAEGQNVKLDDFHLPPKLPSMNIEGIVRWADGSPARGANVFLELADQQRREMGAMVDEQGHFSLSAFEGLKYTVHAKFRENSKPMHAAPISVPADKKLQPVTLIIDQPGIDRPAPPKKTP
jgi:hypothetical protein